MQRILTSLFSVALVAVASHASAGLVLTQTINAKPSAGLDSYTISGFGTAGEIIDSIAGITINGVHNVTPAFGQPSTNASHWTGGNGAGNADWKVYDTYFLFSPSDSTNVVGLLGSMTETNNGANPAGLSLSASGQNATVGLGEYKFGTVNDQVTLTPAGAKNNLAFLQVVLPAGATANLSLTLYANGQATQITDYVVGIPEPATMAMAGMGLIGMIGVARRRKA